ncbi:hypothetical protein AGMMS50230_03360 [Spirochaetia bacterium]|nr:hypothetical protein AGMMS50230_03360 [Spirochaetia bacterium]
MKRILCAVFFVVLVSFGFAQELKFDGYVNSGLGLVMSNVSGVDPQVMTYGVDSERFIGRFRLNGAYTNADKSAGANFRLQVQGRGVAGETANSPSLAFGYGWIKPLDFLTVKAGLVDDSTWQTADFIFNDDLGEGAGMLVKLSPITGLDIGAGAYAASYRSGSNNNFLASGPLPESLNWNRIKYTLNLAYTMPDVFRVTLGGRSWNTAGGTAANGPDNSAKAFGEFRFLAVKDLTAVVVVAADNLYNDDSSRDFSKTGTIAVYETLAYKLSDLRFGLNAAQYKSNTANSDLALHFNPWVSYALFEGKIVPRLDAVYFMGGAKDGANYHRRAYAANYNADTYVITGRPSVKINIDSKTAFEAGDAVYYQKPAAGDSVLTNVFYVDLVIKF